MFTSTHENVSQDLNAAGFQRLTLTWLVEGGPDKRARGLAPQAILMLPTEEALCEWSWEIGLWLSSSFFFFYNLGFLKYILLIMLLQLFHFPLFIPLLPAHPLPPTFPLFSSCPWVIHISSLVSTFPTLFSPSPCLFSTYRLWYLFSVPSPPPPPTPLLITPHVISISVVLFLF